MACFDVRSPDRDGVLKQQADKGAFIGNSLLNSDIEVASDRATSNTYNSLIIDGYDKSFWRGPLGDQETPLPHYVILDFNTKKSISAITYVPVPDKQKGRIKSFSIYASDDGINWKEPIYKGTLPDKHHQQKITLRETIFSRYIKFEANEVYGKFQVAAISELDINE